jgi:hypothetical protein
MVEQLNLNSFNATDVDDTAGSVYTSLLLKQIEFPQGTNKDFAVETFESSERIYCKLLFLDLDDYVAD